MLIPKSLPRHSCDAHTSRPKSRTATWLTSSAGDDKRSFRAATWQEPPASCMPGCFAKFSSTAYGRVRARARARGLGLGGSGARAGRAPPGGLLPGSRRGAWGFLHSNSVQCKPTSLKDLPPPVQDPGTSRRTHREPRSCKQQDKGAAASRCTGPPSQNYEYSWITHQDEDSR